MKRHDNIDWALAYAAAGFAVVPVWYKTEVSDGVWRCACEKGEACDRPAKHPIPRQGVKQATTDKTRLEAWWEEHPMANVAIATGAISQCIVVDVDTGDGKEGDIAITQACAEHGGVPRTLKARSGSGGLHYVYRFRANPFTRKIGFLKHVDYLSDGGYVILQPSENMKGAYKWDDEAGVESPADIGKLRQFMAELPEWFDKLEGTGRAGRKGERTERSRDRLMARIINGAAQEFRPTDRKWVEELPKILSFCDPDSRDDWVLFGIILGREFERNDDGWRIYNDWAARSSKYEDKGTQKAMRSYYYEDSTAMPQGGEPASISTIIKRGVQGGYVIPEGGLDDRRIVSYRPGRAIESLDFIMRLMARERESNADEGRRVYAFGSGLGCLVETHDIGAKYTQEGRPPNGWVLKVSPYTPMGLGSRITHTCTIMRFSATGNTTQVECPTEISTLMLAETAKQFPRLNGIVQWPMVVNKKIVGFDETYDAATGLVFVIPEGLDLSGVSGSKKEAEAAWKWLRDVALDEFPFATDRDQAAALALLLTFMQRRGMASAPAFLVTAPLQGSGKTALIQFASRAVHGRTSSASSLSLVAEEQRKTITAALMSNPPSLFFDNLKQGTSFDSAELAVAMTSGEWEDRKLGSTERLTLPNRAVWCFTGNNVTLTNDLKRRFITVRMIPASKAHFERKFKRNIDMWPVEHRHEMLKALATIALWGAKSDLVLKSESGFVDWDAQVRKAVVALTGLDPFKSSLEEREEEAEDEMEESISKVAMAWAASVGDEKCTVGDFVARCKDALKSSDSAKRRLAEGLDEAIAVLREKAESKLEHQDYGYAIKLLKDRPITVAKVDCKFERAGNRNGSAAWKLLGASDLEQRVQGEF